MATTIHELPEETHQAVYAIVGKVVLQNLTRTNLGCGRSRLKDIISAEDLGELPQGVLHVAETELSTIFLNSESVVIEGGDVILTRKGHVSD